MSLRIAKPKLAAESASNPPNGGVAEPKLPCVNGMSRSAVGARGRPAERQRSVRAVVEQRRSPCHGTPAGRQKPEF